MTENQHKDAFENEFAEQSVQNIYECECPESKRCSVVFDGASTGNYVVEYCQKCYDLDDKQFMISEEAIS